MFRRSHADASISLEEGTESVPRDGWYYVLKNGEVVGRYKNLKKATEVYVRLLDEEGVSQKPEERQLTEEEINSNLVGDFYVYGKSKVKKSTGTRTFG